MIFEIETALKTKLESLELTPGNTVFVNVYDYHQISSEVDGFPYCTFELSDFDGDYLDSCSNTRRFKFNIVSLQAVNKDMSRDGAKDILYTALEKMITVFDGDMDLSEASIVKGSVSKGEMGMFVQDSTQVLGLSVEVELTVVTTASQYF